MDTKFILYVKANHTCPFCEKVRNEIDRLGLIAEERTIDRPEVVEELVERGGKNQVPYLVDIDNAVEMYESEDIVEYLRNTYGTGEQEESFQG